MSEAEVQKPKIEPPKQQAVEIRVVETAQHEEGYYLYKLCYDNKDQKEYLCAWRRFRQMRKTINALKEANSQHQFPPLPPKTVFTNADVSERQKQFQVVLDFIATQPELYRDEGFKSLFNPTKNEKRADGDKSPTVKKLTASSRFIIDALTKPFSRKKLSKDISDNSLSQTSAPEIAVAAAQLHVVDAERQAVLSTLAEHVEVTQEDLEACIQKHCAETNGKVHREKFIPFSRDLLKDKNGRAYPLTDDQLNVIFTILDDDNNGAIDPEELRTNWNKWIKPKKQARSALVVVDVQNDFISGSLALINCPAHQDAAKVVPVINKLRVENEFDLIVYTKDSHPPDHCSFCSQIHKHKLAPDSPIKADDAKLYDIVRLLGPPEVDQKLWPDHCVQGTEGEKLHEDLITDPSDKIVRKGTNSNIDSYSAFFDNAKLNQTELVKLLHNADIDTVFVCGLAYDVCVGSTALHSIELGFQTILVEDACAGVTEQGIADMKTALNDSGCIIVQSTEVPIITSALRNDEKLVMYSVNHSAKARLRQQNLSPFIRYNTYVAA